MVKKKGKSKRVALKDKYKMQKRVVETNRKKRKQSKKDTKAGIVKHAPKDPGIPNSWPFKQDLLKDIQRQRERQAQLKEEQKDKRKQGLRALKEHQDGGGSARTVEELVQQASKDRQQFEAKVEDEVEPERKDNEKQAGQSSRRAYLRELKKVIDSSDVLLQVLDARDPMGSRVNSVVENNILSKHDKKMVLVLNKIDLVPKDVVGQWLNVLRQSHPAIAIKASKDTGSGQDGVDETATTPVGMEGLLQLLKNYARTGDAKKKTTIVVGIIGYPNVGKSSIINALKRSRAVGVSSRPGFTTTMQEVLLDRNVRLLDSPGVVFDDRSAMLGNCVDADSVADPIPAVEALIKRCNPASLIMTYNIPAFPPGNVMMFLAMVARAYGRVLKGGIPDKVGAARAVLRDWNSGKIPYFTPPPKQTKRVAEGAVIVKSFGTEFDVSKYDAEIMNSLKDSDEMDFVELAADLKRNDEEDAGDIFEEDDEMDEDDSDDDGAAAAHVPRQELEGADDYDFDDV